MKIRYLTAGLLFAFIASTAYSFDRPFPQNAKRGTLSLGFYPLITIDGQARKLSAGARIWNRKNRIQVPSSLGIGPYVINYTENGKGDIDRIWVLTDREADRPAQQKSTATP